MGSQNAKEALAYALSLYEPRVAINIGIAGCSDTTVAKGTLFCTTHEGLDIPFATCSSRPKAVDDTLHVTTTLVDMEADTFLQTVPKTVRNICLQDRLRPFGNERSKQSGRGKLDRKSIKQWEKYVEDQKAHLKKRAKTPPFKAYM